MSTTIANSKVDAQPSTNAKLIVDQRRRKYRFEIPKTKNELVKEVLKRWWYGISTWPSTDADYTQLLAEKNLRLVSADKWIESSEVLEGKRKVIGIEAFPGVFKDSQGQTIDLRDSKAKPCFSVLKAKSVPQLAALLKKCLKNQIKELRTSSYYEQNLDYALTKYLTKFMKVYEDFFKETN